MPRASKSSTHPKARRTKQLEDGEGLAIVHVVGEHGDTPVSMYAGESGGQIGLSCGGNIIGLLGEVTHDRSDFGAPGPYERLTAPAAWKT